MCGIFCKFSIYSKITKEDYNSSYLLKHRGPDSTLSYEISDRNLIVFHRLAINDLSTKGIQPFVLDDNLFMVCNGEIYNYLNLKQKYNITTYSNSDCEVILHLFKIFSGDMEKLCQELESSEFVFVIYDKKMNRVYSARDAYGIRPLFMSIIEDTIIFSSEIKALPFDVNPILPGSYNISLVENNKWINKIQKYYTIKLRKYYNNIIDNYIYNDINNLLRRSVNLKVMSERPVGCFLSGGLDSSLILALLTEKIKNIKCFTIGLNENSFDVVASKKVVEFLKIPKENHHIIYFTVEEGFNLLEELIWYLESYDVTTIRASMGQYIISKWIKNNTDIKVLYSGEGSDEIFAGYLYSRFAPDKKELEYDSKRLLNELYMFDNLRVDRTTASNGLEVRVPFLNKELIDYVFSLDPELRICDKYNKQEKTLLRKSFENDNILPNEILWRTKDAFSDAVSSKDVCWYKTLSEKYIHPLISDEELLFAKDKYPFNTPQTKEALYYRDIFSSLFLNTDKVISHYWMPKWVENVNGDPSAKVFANK
jgi:asparagine synthase (glutamine-hydrolysing)